MAINVFIASITNSMLQSVLPNKILMSFLAVFTKFYVGICNRFENTLIYSHATYL
jgi:hypothetical protein